MNRLSLLLLAVLATSCVDLEAPGSSVAHLSADPIAACPVPADPSEIAGVESDFFGHLL